MEGVLLLWPGGYVFLKKSVNRLRRNEEIQTITESETKFTNEMKFFKNKEKNKEHVQIRK